MLSEISRTSHHSSNTKLEEWNHARRTKTTVDKPIRGIVIKPVWLYYIDGYFEKRHHLKYVGKLHFAMWMQELTIQQTQYKDSCLWAYEVEWGLSYEEPKDKERTTYMVFNYSRNQEPLMHGNRKGQKTILALMYAPQTSVQDLMQTSAGNRQYIWIYMN